MNDVKGEREKGRPRVCTGYGFGGLVKLESKQWEMMCPRALRNIE